MSAGPWNRVRLAAAVAALTAVVASYTPQAHHLETLLLDWGIHFLPTAQRPDSVAVVAIDQATLDAEGPWPWSHQRLAQVVARLQALRPSAIGLVLPLSRVRTPATLASLRAELDTLETALRPRAAAWLQRLDGDAQLAAAVATAGNVVLSASRAASAGLAPSAADLELFAIASPLEQTPWHRFLLAGLLSPPGPREVDIRPPFPALRDNAAGVGVVASYRQGQTVLGVPTATRVADRYLPGFELALFLAARGQDRSALSLTPGSALRVGPAETVGAADLGYYPRPADAVAVYSLGDILRDDTLAGDLRGKSLLLGLTVPDLAPHLHGPLGQLHTPVSWSAQVLGSMLDGGSLAVPGWAHGAQPR